MFERCQEYIIAASILKEGEILHKVSDHCYGLCNYF